MGRLVCTSPTSLLDTGDRRTADLDDVGDVDADDERNVVLLCDGMDALDCAFDGDESDSRSFGLSAAETDCARRLCLSLSVGVAGWEVNDTVVTGFIVADTGGEVMDDL